MKHYRIWQAPIFAFFSTQFYRELGTMGRGVGFLYMLALLTIVCAITPIKELSGLQPTSQSVVDQLPVITINQGILSINQPSPYVITDPLSGNYLIAFDTDPEPEGTVKAPVLVKRDGLIIDGPGGCKESSFKGIDHFEFQPESFKRLLCIAAYLVLLPIAWFGHVVQALGFSLAGLLLSKTIGVGIKYEGILRIASVALGNVILLDGIMHIFPLDIPGYGVMMLNIPSWGLYKFVFALGFTLFGVGANLSPPTFHSVSEPDVPPAQR